MESGCAVSRAPGGDPTPKLLGIGGKVALHFGTPCLEHDADDRLGLVKLSRLPFV